MQRIHVRNLFSLFVPFSCPPRAKANGVEDQERNSVGFNLTDSHFNIFNKFEIELFIYDDRTSNVFKLEKNCFSLAKRNAVSVRSIHAGNNIDGISVQLRIDPGVFDFRKLKKEQMCQIRINCFDTSNILIRQALCPSFLIYRKKRAGEKETIGESAEGLDTLYFTWSDNPLTDAAPTVDPAMQFEDSPLLSSDDVSPFDYPTGNRSLDNANYNNSDQLMSEDDSDNLSIVELPYGSGQIQAIRDQNEQYMVLYNGNAEVVGNFRALNFYKASDINIKEDIRKLIDDFDCRDIMMQIDGVAYKFKKGVHAAVNRRFIGFIAQQVESVVPEAVELIDGILHVDYQALIPYMSESVKQNFRDIASRRSETDGMRVIVDNLYANYVTTEQKAPVPTEKKTPSDEQKKESKTPWWQWIIFAVLGLALFAAGGGLTVLVERSLNPHVPPYNQTVIKTPVPLQTLTPSVSNNDDPVDRHVLMELFNATQGWNWLIYQNWMTAVTVCQWPGIVCAKDTGRVTSIVLGNFGLNGTIPESIGNLTQLTLLDLSVNYLYGTIPKSLTRLKSLGRIELSQNNLHGEIPADFANVASLTYFDVSDNEQLSGTFPAWIPTIYSLTNVYLQNCNFSGPLPANCLSGATIRELDITGNKFYGNLPPKIAVTSFKASRNLLEGTLPPTCSNYLNLASNKLTGNTDNIQQPCDFLQVDLSGNMLTGTVPMLQGQIIQLLNLANNNFTSLTRPDQPTSLKSCDFSGNPFKCPLPKWAEDSCGAVCT